MKHRDTLGKGCPPLIIRGGRGNYFFRFLLDFLKCFFAAFGDGWNQHGQKQKKSNSKES
jgi:hypothetical protein